MNTSPTKTAEKRVLAVYHFPGGQRRNVAGEVRNYCNEFAPRFSAVFVGDVFTDDLGLVNVYRHNGIVCNTDFFCLSVSCR